MTNETQALTVARHTTPAAYYEGGDYQLNITFETLRDKQWQRVMDAIWQHPLLFGPLAARYYPFGDVPQQITVQAPPPTATLTQHGQIKIGEGVVGCTVQATRSLFECVSINIPIAMFESIRGGLGMRHQHPELQAVDEIFYDLALKIYDLAPFKIGAIGFERDCQLPIELRSDPQMRHALLTTGNFMAQEDIVLQLEPDLSRYEAVRTNLRWLPPSELA